MKMLEWIEPYSYDLSDVVVTMRVSEAGAIKIQKDHALRSSDFMYIRDEYALDDFMNIHWAHRVEVTD